MTRNAESTQVNEDAKKSVIDAGGVVRSLTSDERQQWVTAMKPVWAQFEDDIGSDLLVAAQAANVSN